MTVGWRPGGRTKRTGNPTDNTFHVAMKEPGCGICEWACLRGLTSGSSYFTAGTSTWDTEAEHGEISREPDLDSDLFYQGAFKEGRRAGQQKR